MQLARSRHASAEGPRVGGSEVQTLESPFYDTKILTKYSLSIWAINLRRSEMKAR